MPKLRHLLEGAEIDTEKMKIPEKTLDFMLVKWYHGKGGKYEQSNNSSQLA